jgi:hypothetical protein
MDMISIYNATQEHVKQLTWSDAVNIGTLGLNCPPTEYVRFIGCQVEMYEAEFQQMVHLRCEV